MIRSELVLINTVKNMVSEHDSNSGGQGFRILFLYNIHMCTGLHRTPSLF